MYISFTSRSVGQVTSGAPRPGQTLLAVGLEQGGSELVQVGGPVLGFEGERFETLVNGFVQGTLLLLHRALLLLLGVREAGGDPWRGRAVAGRRPHWRLQHLHGVVPLAGGDGHLVQGRAWIGQSVGVGGGVLPRGLGGPCLGFTLLRGRIGRVIL